ncbi:hypothetical protein [Photorhabdus bodei]|uniref:hypothetical protein n=1 Tax=Photorhabdus bodei TaxID=2029681 RepID=UPI001EE40B3F|nr:hypothetical protein [Photorhabdus bodei]
MFFNKLMPLKYAEVIQGLTALGFEMKPKKGTSHEFKVTTHPGELDCLQCDVTGFQ